jgi:sortase A
MRRRVVTIFSILLIIVGISTMLFPFVSNTIGTQIANYEIECFDEMLENIVDDETYQEALSNGEIDSESYPIDENGKRLSNTPLIFKPDLDRLYADSISYNENLKSNQGSLLVDETSYESPAINLNDYGIYTGIYGYVTINSINMRLPIYLGANDTNMSYGAAHLSYTSLPLGGKSTNAVLAGHTGYIGRIFFDNLRNLNTGDEVELTNYWYTINYKVIDTKVCKPSQSQDIFISDGSDLLTMITCISDGAGGFNRYYVICERS